MKKITSLIAFSILLLIPTGIQSSFATGGEQLGLGEITWFAGNFAPTGTVFCNGGTLNILENTDLFSLIGTVYGGDGRTTFGLPDLQSRMPMHQGTGPGLSSYFSGRTGGTETETLSIREMTHHSHFINGSSAAAESTDPKDKTVTKGIHTFFHRIYRLFDTEPLVNMHTDAIGVTGQNQPHNNMPPFLNINCLVNLIGVNPFFSGPTSESFLGEIRWVTYPSARPQGWADCDGQILPKNDFPELHAVLGDNFGASATVFSLPDLRGRMPMHSSTDVGQKGGLEQVELTEKEISHTHKWQATMSGGDSTDPADRLLAKGTHPYAHRIYSSGTPNIAMRADSLSPVGGFNFLSTDRHNNLPPFLTLRCIVNVEGGADPTSNNPGPEPFVGEIRWFGGDFAPRGYAKCDGSLQNIADNPALFSILGTTYGGDGETTFALPNLEDRIPMHPGAGAGLSTRTLGETGGTPTVELSAAELPAHTHSLRVSSQQGQFDLVRSDTFFAKGFHPNYHKMYSDQGQRVEMHESAISNPFGLFFDFPDRDRLPSPIEPHENLPPHQKITCLIATDGVLPI